MSDDRDLIRLSIEEYLAQPFTWLRKGRREKRDILVTDFEAKSTMLISFTPLSECKPEGE